MIKNKFLEQLYPIKDDDWEEIVEGRIARLALKGQLGALDIFVVYLTSGSAGKAERLECIQKVDKAIKDKNSVLSIITGDFNFVEHTNDRFCASLATETGRKQTRWPKLGSSNMVCSIGKMTSIRARAPHRTPK